MGAESGKYTTSISSAAPSALAGNFSHIFGDVNAGGGLKLPAWLLPVALVLLFVLAIVAVIIFGRKK